MSRSGWTWFLLPAMLAAGGAAAWLLPGPQSAGLPAIRWQAATGTGLHTGLALFVMALGPSLLLGLRSNAAPLQAGASAAGAAAGLACLPLLSATTAPEVAAA
ncbi:hypothetical protein ICN82_21155, partial [Mangrovicoccus sp. HB182678]